MHTENMSLLSEYSAQWILFQNIGKMLRIMQLLMH